MTFKFLLCLTFFILAVLAADLHAQEDRPGIKLIARPAGDSILLRWAPSSPAAWKVLNQYGYRIERITIVSKGQVLNDKSQTIISPALIKPAPESSWVKPMDEDDYVAVMAQAIFGTSFTVSTKGTTFMDAVQQSKELESRFSFALFAADISPAAAALAGLRYVDKNVNKDEKYLYRIYSNAPEDLLPIDHGSIYTSLSDYYPLPRLPKPVARLKESVIVISCPIASFDETFTNYYVEKSENQKDFKKLTNLPLVPAASQGTTVSELMVTDSVFQVGSTYTYRVVGITPFGEKSTASDGISITVSSLLKANPGNVRIANTGDSQIKVVWDFPTESEKSVKGFEIERSNYNDHLFETVSKLLPPNAREFTDTTFGVVNYYRVKALGFNENVNYSFPVFHQLEDSIPPLAPHGLVAKMDSIGNVFLKWSPNNEKDLLGYRVYRSEFINSEFSQITASPIANAEFADRIDVRTINRHAYYKITAVDKRYNTSPFSTTVKVVRPDILPPVSGEIQNYRIDQNKVFISCLPSSSTDVLEYRLLMRAGQGDDKIVKIFKANDELDFLTEELNDGIYSFCLETIDSAGNKSVGTCMDLSIHKRVHKQIEKVRFTIDRSKKTITVAWRYEEGNLRSFLIYRSKNDEPLSLYRKSDENFFLDKNVEMDTNYLYRIKVVFADGSESLLSEEIKIKF